MTPPPIPFFDRTRGDLAMQGELAAVFEEVVRSGHYILGPQVEAFESECAAYLGVRHAIGVSSGTDALLVALMALGIGPGDEVVCPAYTFFATAGAVHRTGATPVFADVLPGSFNLDPASAERAVTARTRAILAVHLFGDCAPMDELLAIAAPRGVPVIEDAAQAFGAERAGRRAGGLGAIGCFSFFPTKNLGGFGDGGLVTTDRDDLAERVRSLRAQGARRKHHHTLVGGNFRLDALQAALLRRKLPRLSALLQQRRRHAERYTALLGGADLPLALPALGNAGHTFNQYVIRLKDTARRDPLRNCLAAQGIGTEIYYPAPLHLQPCFAPLGPPAGALPVAEAAARETLALPIFPELTGEEVARVASAILSFFGGAPAS
ncbi:aminotransferase DegT [Sorangium cellulosum]|uniref:Aminotransferase DegT n=1 Tax=Sorangium cellulosum TaxID=56 RepID=A0A2L0F6N1_SORCE|nr:DegT/DnrJ/EryC1/StrS family aminotransferase [Sorangium cellulosum]AUX47177.1 aminotransferase DegT [Sorangium cellulosum]